MKAAIPTSLIDAIRFFSDPDVCLNFMVAIRWPDGVTCPTCGSSEVGFLKTRRLWKCKNRHSKQQFSAKVGTIFEDSPISLDKWFMAMWLVANCNNGVSSHEIARDLKVTQKTAWFMDHRIRRAMETGSFEKMKGEIEADESMIGGLARFMHKDKRAEKITGTGGAGKAIVMGLLDRETGKVHVKHVADRQRHTLQKKSAITSQKDRKSSRMLGSGMKVWTPNMSTASLTTPRDTSMGGFILTVWKTSGPCSSVA